MTDDAYRRPNIYDVDRNGPILDDDDEAILDRIWDRIGKERTVDEDDEHRGFVEQVATELWEVANRYVPVVLGNDPSRHEVPAAFIRLIEMQPVNELSQFQFPEPSQGVVMRPACLVIGQNPGVDHDAILPTHGCTREEYIQTYRDRFIRTHRHPVSKLAVDYYPHRIRSEDSNRPIVIAHYRKVEALLAPAFGKEAIGCNVTYMDAMPWKSVGKHFHYKLQNDPEILEMARERVARFVTRLQPALIVTLGRFAASPFGTRPQPITQVEEHCINSADRQWCCKVIPLYHVNARPRHAPRSYWDAAKQLLVSDASANP
jgi:hypothetical protein